MLDTTAFSAAMRHDPEIMAFLCSRQPGDLATVPPVVIAVLPWTSRSSAAFGAFKTTLERAGELIDDFDIAIAAIASSHKTELITANLVHFRRIPGLACRHWSR